jgi:hypothetical protein
MDISKKIIGAIGIVVIVIVLLSMTSVVIDQVMAIMYGEDAANASIWNFTGHTGAESMLGLVPFVWIASILIAAAVGMFAIAKS